MKGAKNGNLNTISTSILPNLKIIMDKYMIEFK